MEGKGGEGRVGKMEWQGREGRVGGLLLRDWDGKGRKRGNEGERKRMEGTRKGRQEPVPPIKNRSHVPKVLRCV